MKIDKTAGKQWIRSFTFHQQPVFESQKLHHHNKFIRISKLYRGIYKISIQMPCITTKWIPMFHELKEDTMRKNVAIYVVAILTICSLLVLTLVLISNVFYCL